MMAKLAAMPKCDATMTSDWEPIWTAARAVPILFRSASDETRSLADIARCRLRNAFIILRSRSVPSNGTARAAVQMGSQSLVIVASHLGMAARFRSLHRAISAKLLVSSEADRNKIFKKLFARASNNGTARAAVQMGSQSLVIVASHLGMAASFAIIVIVPAPLITRGLRTTILNKLQNVLLEQDSSPDVTIGSVPSNGTARAAVQMGSQSLVIVASHLGMAASFAIIVKLAEGSGAVDHPWPENYHFEQVAKCST
jgi:tRNA C32,U32 (ribose-2'-O)-methylase TrmJ